MSCHIKDRRIQFFPDQCIPFFTRYHVIHFQEGISREYQGTIVNNSATLLYILEHRFIFEGGHPSQHHDPMNRIIVLLFTAFALFTAPMAYGQTENPNFDPDLALRLGADDYGMKNYIFVILKTGDNPTTDRAFIDSCFAGHLQNIGRLAEMKKLVVAGPFGRNDDDLRGIFILDATSPEEARKLLDTDPAIHAGLLKPLLYPWYGSAALSEYLNAADRIWKKDI